jgi:hypothetical protein
MRYGSVLQRRLVKLESTIKVPNLEDQWAAIQAEALSNLSVEDLRILREIVVNQAAGIAVEDTPLNHQVVQRCNAACDQSRRNHPLFAPKPQTERRNTDNGA